MNSKWGPIKDCRWHFCTPFAGDFSSHPVLVMWPNGVNHAFGNKKVLRLWKCWWNISYRYHSLSCLSFTHQAFTRIGRGHSSSGFLEARWSRSGSIDTLYSTWNQVNRGNLSQWIIISFQWWYWTRWLIISPKQSLFDCLDLIAPKMEHPEMKAASSGTKHCCLEVLGCSHGFRCLIIDPASNTNVELWQALFAYDHCIRSQS